MKNKVVTIVSIILAISALLCFGYIFINSSKNNEEKNTEEQNQNDNNNEEEVNLREEKGKNIAVGSRIGVQLHNIIKYSNMYSELITKELDDNGITDKAKVFVAIDNIVSSNDYIEYMEYSANYISPYVSESNISKVLSNIFENPSITNHTNIMGEGSYDAENHNYILIPVRYPGETQEYTIEVPYKIMQFDDRIELYAYRVYVTKVTSEEEENITVHDYLYYDKTKSLLITTINDNSTFLENNQFEYINNLIENNIIDTSSLEEVEYIFSKEDEGMRLKDYKKIR